MGFIIIIGFFPGNLILVRYDYDCRHPKVVPAETTDMKAVTVVGRCGFFLPSSLT